MSTSTRRRDRAPWALLYLALAAVLVASWTHVAAAFGALEHGGPPAVLRRVGPLVGPLAAVAIDLGLIALAWAIGARKRAGRPVGDLWLGAAVFAGLSALANFDHALRVIAGDAADPVAVWSTLAAYDKARILALSATLPLLALYLTRVVETAADTGPGAAPGDVLTATSSTTGRAPAPKAKASNGARARRQDGPEALADLVAARPTIDVAAAARALGVTRPTVYAWAQAAGLDRGEDGRWRAGGG